MKFAHIENGIVANISVADSEENAFGGIPVGDIPVAIGWGYDGITFSPPVKSMSEVKFAALAAIDAEAGAARARYITIAPGQETTYLLKAQQAAAFKAAGYTGTVPGLVQAEVDATGATPQEAADAILAEGAAWEYKAAQIESARRRGKVAVGNATDVHGVQAAQAAAVAELVVL